MAIEIPNFILTNEQYSSGMMLDEYKDKYSLTSAYIGNDGQAKIKWAYRQEKDKDSDDPRASKPGKVMPIKLDLGTKEEAVKHLNALLDMLDPDGTLRVPF